MPATLLSIDSVELVSTLRKAPLNGAPSTQDYNDSETEKLADLNNLASLLNDVLLPLVAGRVLDAAADTGLEGRTLLTDSSDSSELFQDQTTKDPLTIAASMRLVYALMTANKRQLDVFNAQLVDLSNKLASTNQNDIAYALQGMTDTIGALQGVMQSQSDAITELQVGSNTRRMTVHATLPQWDSTIDPVRMQAVDFTFDIPFIDNNYIVHADVEQLNNLANTEDVWVGPVVKKVDGTGVTVYISRSAAFDCDVNVFVTARHN